MQFVDGMNWVYSIFRLKVVVKDLPEIRDVVSEENVKYLCGKNDTNHAAKCIIEVAKDADLRKEIGERNRQKCKKMFSVSENFEKIIRLVEEKVEK